MARAKPRPESGSARAASEKATRAPARGPRPLYTPEQRRRRDATPWTLVQGLLAPAQFVAFVVSLVLVFRTLSTGQGATAASVSVVIKTLFLYAIMVTGAIWEKRVFDRYLFADAFFWEDVFSMLVIALHSAYLVALFGGFLGTRGQLLLALAAFGAYVINATQFILKLRAARLGERDAARTAPFDPPSRKPSTLESEPLRGAP